MTRTGVCGCGRVRYTIKTDPLFTHACHCQDCQRSTGSAFVVHLMVPERDFEIEGETGATTLPTGSGAGYDPHFCPECGTYIWSKYHLNPAAMVAVRGGTLDDTSDLVVQAHIFTRSKQPWMTLEGDTPSFEEAYEREELWPADSLARYRDVGG